MLPIAKQEEFSGVSPDGAGSDPLENEELPWLLPRIIGDVPVAASSGVFEFQVGVPIECCFDDLEFRVAGVVVEPLLLKPGLHNVYLHFYDLVRNSIVFGELRLTGENLTFALPFSLTVGEIAQENFTQTQIFSEKEQQEWQERFNSIGESVWEKAGQRFMARLPEFERQILQRPCEQKDVERLEQEFNRGLALFRGKRERLRSREAFLPDPPKLLEAMHRVRVALRQSFAAHDKARALVLEVRQLVERGHVRRAAAEAVEVRQKIADFSDLSLDFVGEAEVQYHRRRQMLLVGALLLAVGILVTLIIIKVFIHTAPTPP